MAVEFDGDRMLKRKDSDLPEHPIKPLCACTAFSCNKLFLFLYACLYLIVGIGLLLVGVWIILESKDYATINNDLFIPTIMMIGVGFIIIINSIVGISGVLKENAALLRLFLAVTVIAFLTQVAIGVLAFVYRQQITDTAPYNFSSSLMYLVRDYSKLNTYTAALDSLQTKFECCGFESYVDYENNTAFQCGTGHRQACGVPWTCCKKLQGGESLKIDCGYGVRWNGTMPVNRIYTMGCTDKFLPWLSFNLDIVGAVGLGSSIPQIFGILLAYYMIRRVRENKMWYRVGT